MDLKNKKYYQLGEVMQFGKYKGMTIETIILHDPRYIQWACDNIPDFYLSDGSKHALQERIREDLNISQLLHKAHDNF